METTKESLSQAVEQQMKLAQVWQNRGKITHAIANYEKAIQLQPDYLPPYLHLVQLLVQTGQTQQAIDTYRQGIETAIAKVWFPPHQAREEYRKALKQRQEIGQAPRVLLYTNCPGTYGAEQISHALMLRLVNSGYEVICVQSQADHHLIQARQALGIEHIWLKDDAYQFGYTVGNALEVAEINILVFPGMGW